jgi:6-phosphofructokinase
VPEYDYTLEWLGERARQAIEHDGFALIVLSEGAAGKDTLTNDLAQETGVRVRDIRLGHAQRGSRPSHIDRKLAVNMAHMAYEGLCNGIRSATVLLRDNQLVLHNGTIADFPKPFPDVGLYNRVNGVS